MSFVDRLALCRRVLGLLMNRKGLVADFFENMDHVYLHEPPFVFSNSKTGETFKVLDVVGDLIQAMEWLEENCTEDDDFDRAASSMSYTDELTSKGPSITALLLHTELPPLQQNHSMIYIWFALVTHRFRSELRQLIEDHDFEEKNWQRFVAPAEALMLFGERIVPNYHAIAEYITIEGPNTPPLNYNGPYVVYSDLVGVFRDYLVKYNALQDFFRDTVSYRPSVRNDKTGQRQLFKLKFGTIESRFTTIFYGLFKEMDDVHAIPRWVRTFPELPGNIEMNHSTVQDIDYNLKFFRIILWKCNKDGPYRVRMELFLAIFLIELEFIASPQSLSTFTETSLITPNTFATSNCADGRPMIHYGFPIPLEIISRQTEGMSNYEPGYKESNRGVDKFEIDEGYYKKSGIYMEFTKLCTDISRLRHDEDARQLLFVWAVATKMASTLDVWIPDRLHHILIADRFRLQDAAESERRRLEDDRIERAMWQGSVYIGREAARSKIYREDVAQREREEQLAEMQAKQQDRALMYDDGDDDDMQTEEQDENLVNGNDDEDFATMWRRVMSKQIQKSPKIKSTARSRLLGNAPRSRGGRPTGRGASAGSSYASASTPLTAAQRATVNNAQTFMYNLGSVQL